MEKNTTGRPLAVVTGASSGIGFELAKQFADHGFDLILAAEDEGIETATREIQMRGGRAEGLRTDLARKEGVKALCSRIAELNRPVDAIAINAGVGTYGDFVRDIRLRDDLNLIQLNVVSSVHLAKLVLKDMVKRGKGRVLITSSIASTMPGPLGATYSASKAFLQSFAQAIRNELKGTGVTVTSLMPGATETNFFRRAGMSKTVVGEAKKDDATQVAKEGFEALMAGKDQIVTGSLTNTLYTLLARVLPDPIKARIHRKEMEPAKKTSGKRKAA